MATYNSKTFYPSVAVWVDQSDSSVNTSHLGAGTGSTTSKKRRTYLKFDLSSIPTGSTIQTATLTVNCKSGTGTTWNGPHNFYAKKSPISITSSLNWSGQGSSYTNADAISTTSSAAVSVNNKATAHSFNVKTITSSFIASNNAGYVIVATSEGTKNQTKAFYPSSNTTYRPSLTVNWAVPTYTISYQKGTYGTGSTVNVTKTYNVALTLKGATFTRTGYTQTAWASNAAGTTKAYNLSASYTANAAATLYPYWSENYLTINCYPNGGTQTSAQSSSYPLTNGYYSSNYYYDNDYTTNGVTNVGTLFTAPAGHKIVAKEAWNTKADGTGTSINHNAAFASGQAIAEYFGKTLVSASQSINLYANWQPWQHDVVFDANGGSGAPASQTKTYGGIIYITTDTPTRPGYTFSSWNTESNGSGTPYAPGQAYGYDQDGDPVTLFAQWTPNTYTITYDANGGTGAPSATTYTYTDDATSTVKLDSNHPRLEGYKFLGWSTAKDDTVEYEAGADFHRNIATNTTLYAVWEVNNYTITFHVNGGVADAASLAQFTQTYSYNLWPNDTILIPWPEDINLKYFGHILIKDVEWNSEPDGSGFSIGLNDEIYPRDLDEVAKSKNGNLVFYANWRIAGRIALYTSQNEKVFVFPRVCTDAATNTWTRAMAYVYKNGEWKPTIEPIGGLENIITIYPDYPVGENSINLHNVITGSTDDLIYPSV